MNIMPHSSGGGSSSGGSFGGSGGSFHSGGSSRGSRSYSYELHEPAYYHHWHHGCFTYVRYINGVPDYRYWDNTALQSDSARIFSIILAVIFLLSFSLPGLAVVLSGIYTATPVTKVSPHARWEEVVDDEDCFTNAEEEDISKEIHTFYQETGIISRVVTVSENDVGSQTLEEYAYTRYSHEFTTENNWLIVFENEPDGQWDFIGMQGDSTDHILTEKKTAKFNEDLTDKLWNSDEYTYGTAFVSALSDFNGTVTKTEIDWSDTGFGMIFVAAGILVFVTILHSVIAGNKVTREVKNGGFHKLNNPEFTEDASGMKTPKMLQCPYCGGLFASGEQSCPHCGASASEAKEYTMASTK